MTSPDWLDQPVAEAEQLRLTSAQETRLLALTAALRDDHVLMRQMGLIKEAIADGLYEEAGAYWDELDHNEQTTLWVAPKYGGVFTTHERKVIKGEIT